MKTSDLGGVDSLYSIVQMPSGIPVATVAINGGCQRRNPGGKDTGHLRCGAACKAESVFRKA